MRCIESEADVLAANRAFYEAFEARDIDAMSESWEHSDRVVCTHPGWASLHGWAAVAWVTVDENLISETISGTVAAVNMFVFDGQRWRLVVHHGAPVAAR